MTTMLVRRDSDENLDDCCCTVARSVQIGVNKQTLSIQIENYTRLGGATEVNRALAATTAVDKVPITGLQ
ncbi:unnamed protein product [Gongylonema pulchrum]|uniref:Outer membrane protein n=1 Tax=Gongylonema pulchrum TaxID=637853 RepID=A0A183EE94_9BILA|nr:unnamed protein product [Gongylonema pulchrum]